MKFNVVLVGICLQCIGLNSFIVPDEVPTILSLIYSNIPTIKKGTDSRIGWGFRLGDRADFQVLVELGPQKNTQPIGNQDNDSNKRHVDHNAINVLYAQALAAKQRQEEQQKKKLVSNTDGGKWIDQWSEDMNPVKIQVPIQEASLASLGIGEIDAKSVIPEDGSRDAVETVQVANVKPAPMRIRVRNGGDGRKPTKTHEEIREKVPAKPTKTILRTTLSPKDALDNVDLDD